jgi:autophagy-related protein 13
VEASLNDSSSPNSSNGGRPDQKSDLVLERWKIDLSKDSYELPPDLIAVLPTIYKRSIVLFRSLFTYAKFLPAWKLAKKLTVLRGPNKNSLKVKCRVVSIDRPRSGVDGLTARLLDDHGPVTEDFSFGTTESPAGSFSVIVSYRTNCDFRIDNSEALLSSQFLGMEEPFFQPSLGSGDGGLPDYMKGGKEIGSLPTDRRDYHVTADRTQAYGSLSTFHQVGPPTSSSPISALRDAKDFVHDSPSPPVHARHLPPHRIMAESKAVLRGVEGASGTSRRPSVSFKPFKAPSLSASPAQNEMLPPPPPSPSRNSLGKTAALGSLAQARSRNSVGSVPQSALRGTSAVPENAIASSASGSPRPAPITRYASSFSHRKGRLSSGGASRTEDDGSSGKGSISSAQPGSGILNEAGPGGSSGSVPTDDDNIADFVKMLDSKKNLKSFETATDPSGSDASTKRTSAALSKFQKMRESNNALSDSMSSSVLLHRSSSSSSRQLSSVPLVVGGASISTSSSPGKPISPHTPHTPAIPSGLSANSIVEYTQPHRNRSSLQRRQMREEIDTHAHPASDDTVQDNGTNAIDIPTSPRLYQTHARRSSSVVQEHRTLNVTDSMGDFLPFGIRSASMGPQDRPPPSLSALLAMQEASVEGNTAASAERSLQPAASSEDSHSMAMARQPSSSFERDDIGHHMPRGGGVAAGSLTSPYRPRIGRVGGRGATPPQGGSSCSSLEHPRQGSSGTNERPGSRQYSFRGMTTEDEEPLLFAMSELGAGRDSRRSLEERGGDSGGSSRRGSRRGARGDHAWS